MHKYVLYGLGVHSQIPLFGHGAVDCPNDVTVRWSRSGYSREPVTPESGEIRILWPEFGEMSIRACSEIVMRTDEDAEITHVRHLVNGIGLGLALHQRGVFALHASAVAIDGHAIAIVGAKGAGKSTLVAALSARGHALLTDDVVALDLPEHIAPHVRPGPANMNLWPDSALATGYDPAAFGRIWSRSPKLAGSLARPWQLQPVPLAAIIMLSRTTGELFQLERVPGLEAFSELVGHSYAFRWIEDRECLPRHLAQCGTVLARVPVFRLRRDDSLDSLSTLAGSVEEWFAAVGSSTLESERQQVAAGSL